MKRVVICALCFVVWGSAPQASGGLWEDVFRGLDYAATPSGFPVFSSGDGGQVNGGRYGRVRILPDRVGQGYTLEFDRVFGPDTRGRPELLDLGALELQLNGLTSATAGFTRRGFLIGNANFIANNLAYAVRDKTGAQDLELTGTMNVANAIEVNQFGFYTLDIDVTNTNSQLIADGVVVRDTEDMNFDVGPIRVEGNIFFDGLVALLASAGVDTTALEELSPKSPIDAIVEEMQSALNSQTLIAGEQLTRDDVRVSTSPITIDAARSIEDALTVAPTALTQTDGNSRSFVPEPGALLLIGVGGAVLWRVRRS